MRPVTTTVFALIATGVQASAATVVSETTWGGQGSDITKGVAVAPDGGAYLAGSTQSFDPSGQPIVFWSRSRRTPR
ncbi:MAG TPA: hypothetical protein VFC19_30670 [Candidatus Limnocylindrales bacterium]|nr:hypothetical protein [Candidatus Limnocylindrales bacterium]